MENKLSQKAKIFQNKERLVISFNEQERIAADIYDLCLGFPRNIIHDNGYMQSWKTGLTELHPSGANLTKRE